MNFTARGLFKLIVTATILSTSSPALAFSTVFGEVDSNQTVRTNFINDLNTNTSSTVIDDGINFGAAPATGTVASVSRNGNIGTESFSYTIYDVDFNTSPPGFITPGIDNPVNDILELDNIVVETPAGQQNATGSYDWGVDSGTGGGKRNSPNAALFDFTGNSIGHFGIDLHDFEAGKGVNSANSGASGEIRLYQSESLVHSYTLEFPGVEGGGSTDRPGGDPNDSLEEGYGNNQSMFVGISADNPNEFFDQVAFVVGDDDVGDDGYTEQWAADGFTFGYAYREVPFDCSPTLGFFLIGGFYVIHKIKRRLS